MQARKTNRSKKDFITAKGGTLSPALTQKYAVRITDCVKDTMRGDVKNDPVAKQYIPQAQELKILPQENIDPIGDDAHSPVKGLIHRYPDRVLFKVASVCAIYCRYCFRREQVGPKHNKSGDILDDAEIDAAISYIENHPEIWEVILSGGDPLVLSPRRLDEILDRIDAIDHVQTIRIHSRVPIADPKRVGDDLLNTLKRDKPIYMVVHINHAQELSDDVKSVLKKLGDAGCVLLSQSVLLKGVNDKAETLEALFRSLTALKVKPYQLHHPDLTPGTSHFRMSLKEGQRIVSKLQGRLSGHALPNYMLDIPGGFGKVPINASYVTALDNGDYLIEDPKGIQHHYKDA